MSEDAKLVRRSRYRPEATSRIRCGTPRGPHQAASSDTLRSCGLAQGRTPVFPYSTNTGRDNGTWSRAGRFASDVQSRSDESACLSLKGEEGSFAHVTRVSFLLPFFLPRPDPILTQVNRRNGRRSCELGQHESRRQQPAAGASHQEFHIQFQSANSRDDG